MLTEQTFNPPPFNMLSPYQIWDWVVPVSGISSLAYMLVKVVGFQKSLGLWHARLRAVGKRGI